MYILDTDTLTHLHKGNDKVRNHLKNAADFEFVTTIVTKVEILRGRIDFLLKANDGFNLEKAQQFLIESENLLAQIPILKFEKNSLDKFDELRQNSKFRKIGRNDLLIASICLANHGVLVTRNTRHFKQFQNLDVENWVD